jgi:secretion/DNA translocation related TadE-like protein
VVAAAMVAVLLSITSGGAYLGSAVVARHRAQAAADLAALAAAERLPAGPETACAQATAVARGMQVDGIHCAVDDLDVMVTVEVRVAVGGWSRARAAARAGPDDAVQPRRWIVSKGPAEFNRRLKPDRTAPRRRVRHR